MAGPLSQAEAEAACVALGSNLASIHTDADQVSLGRTIPLESWEESSGILRIRTRRGLRAKLLWG